jgi:protein SCO1
MTGMTEDQNLPTPPPLPRRHAAGTAVAVALIALGIVSAIIINQKRKTTAEGARAIIEASARKAEDLPVIGTVVDFTLKEASGMPVTMESLRGRVWIADFHFTYCGAACPRMNRNMSDLHREFVGKDEPKFVSITVDPSTDTPELLEEHARMYQADRARWWFLTGDPKEIGSLAEQLKLVYSATDRNAHSTKFALVDREGNVRGVYDGDAREKTAYDGLRRDLAALLAAPPKG